MKYFNKKNPKIYGWSHKTGISIFPYLSIQWHRFQGPTSIGCVKLHITFGWAIFSAAISWDHGDASIDKWYKTHLKIS